MKRCQPSLIILMDFLFIVLFILLYNSSTNSGLTVSLPDTFPSDFVATNNTNKDEKNRFICPKDYIECNDKKYLEIPNDLRDLMAKELFNSFFPPSSCNGLIIPLSKQLNGRTWLDRKKLIELNDCLKKNTDL